MERRSRGGEWSRWVEPSSRAPAAGVEGIVAAPSVVVAVAASPAKRSRERKREEGNCKGDRPGTWPHVQQATVSVLVASRRSSWAPTLSNCFRDEQRSEKRGQREASEQPNPISHLAVSTRKEGSFGRCDALRQHCDVRHGRQSAPRNRRKRQVEQHFEETPADTLLDLPYASLTCARRSKTSQSRCPAPGPSVLPARRLKESPRSFESATI